jgi:hypothetical protein
MCVLWGMPYLPDQDRRGGADAGQLVLLRTGFAAALLPAVRACGRARSLRSCGTGSRCSAFAVLELAVPWWLLASAETRLSSSLTGLLVAAVPAGVRVRRPGSPGTASG